MVQIYNHSDKQIVAPIRRYSNGAIVVPANNSIQIEKSFLFKSDAQRNDLENSLSKFGLTLNPNKVAQHGHEAHQHQHHQLTEEEKAKHAAEQAAKHQAQQEAKAKHAAEQAAKHAAEQKAKEEAAAKGK